MASAPPVSSVPTPASPVSELALRWRRAREAALAPFLGGAPADDRPATWSRVAPSDHEAAWRRVFDHGTVLGRGFRRHYGVDLTLVDVAELLPTLGAPCHRRGLTRADDEPAWLSAGSRCGMAGVPGGCAWWREATAGLVGGLSSTVRYTRVRSPAAGGACVDLLHVDARTRLRFAPVEPRLRPQLDLVARLAHGVDPGARLAFLGFTEGALHYTLEPGATGGGCGGCGGLGVVGVVERGLRRHLPDVRCVDASPRPVLAESP